MAVRILIVEQDFAFSEQLALFLIEQGFDIEQYYDAEQGLTAALAESFDLLILDLSLDGLNLLQALRNKKQTPVMVLSPNDNVEKRIASFQQGGDDYLAKPINFTELTLRLNALLRRTLSKERLTKRVIDVDQLSLHKPKQQVLYDGADLELTPIQFRLLWVLVENRDQVVSKPYLYKAVLDRAFNRYDRSLDMHLSRIRKKLSQMGMAADRLATVHGKGYRFS